LFWRDYLAKSRLANYAINTRYPRYFTTVGESNCSNTVTGSLKVRISPNGKRGSLRLIIPFGITVDAGPISITGRASRSTRNVSTG